MKILFLTYHFPTPDEPGAARPWGEAQLLKELGHVVTVITAGTHYMTGEITQKKRRLWTREKTHDMTVIKTFSTANYRRSSFGRLLNYFLYSCLTFLAILRTSHQDTIIATVDVLTDPILKIPIGCLLSKIKQANFIVDLRDPYPEVAEALGYIHSKFLIGIVNMWQVFFLKHASHIIAATPGIKRILVVKGIDKNKISLLPNAFYQVSLSGDNDGSEIRSKAYVPPGSEFIVLCAGGLGQSKEVLTVLKAAKIAKEREANPIKFMFVGEGEKKNDYLRFCSENNLDNCYFMTALPKKELRDLIQQVDVCVYSLPKNNFWRCALSNTVFDYLAGGKPLVFAGIGDTDTLIKHAQAGLTVEPGNPQALAEAILELYNNPEARETMGKKGKEYLLKNYSKEKLLRKLDEVLERAVRE